MATLGITNTLDVHLQADSLRAGGSRVELLRGRDKGGVKALLNLGDECVVISGVDSAEVNEEVESSRMGGGMVAPVEEDRLRVISSKLIFLFMSGVADNELLTRCWVAGLTADSAIPEPPESAWILLCWPSGLGVRRRPCSLLVDLLPLLCVCLLIVPSPTTALCGVGV